MMQTAYTMHHCQRCGIITDHCKLTYIEQIVYCCVVCQNDEVVELMNKTYTVVSIDEKDRDNNRRRMVVVEIERTSTPDMLHEKAKGIQAETMLVQYPAYGGEHYTAAVAKHPSGGTINHVEAAAISAVIKEMI
jgi:hypothetical protein